jgi:hypothetical protein
LAEASVKQARVKLKELSHALIQHHIKKIDFVEPELERLMHFGPG